MNTANTIWPKIVLINQSETRNTHSIKMLKNVRLPSTFFSDLIVTQQC